MGFKDMDCDEDQQRFEKLAKEATGDANAKYLGADEETLLAVVKTDNSWVYIDEINDAGAVIDHIVPDGRD